MEIKCPNCMGALVFDADSGQMECKYCQSFFRVDDIETPQSDKVECNMYACTSCGAELAINDTETSTFCAYCGQPTIVFSRVSNTQMPDFVVPFRISKQNAMDRIRSQFKRGLFVPKEVKHLEMDKMHGIYIPYWLYDASCYDKKCIKGTVKQGKTHKTKYFIREAKCQFNNLPVDASSALNDISARRLEPYDMSEIKEFRTGYMAGFYADGYDMSKTALQEDAKSRMRSMFDDQILMSCNATDKSIIHEEPKIEIKKEHYAMLPAWFMTFRYEDEPHTIMVNGQTGKVIGAVPLDHKKVKITAIILFLLSLLVCIPLGIKLSSYLSTLVGKDLLFYGIAIIFVIGAMIKKGYENGMRLEESISLTTSHTMDKYAHNRQEGGKEFE